MAAWIFERRTRDGGASGEAVPNAVEAGGWASTEELLVREAIQNSVDAAAPGADMVRVSFRIRRYVSQEKRQIAQALDIASIAQRNDQNQLKLLPGNAFESMRDDDTPLGLLYIEDFNTNGLGGALEGVAVGNFYRLLFVIGDGSKGNANDGSGGSFGFGKGVYAYNSNIRTIFAFSVFNPDESTDGVWARLLGCSYLPSHQFNGKEWTGRAWYGVPPSSDDSGQSPYPLVNEAACEMASRLGFAKRDLQSCGTSILVVGCEGNDGGISIDRLAHAAETWWWPRIVDGQLAVTLENDGVRHPGLDPARRPDLQPFIKARNCLLNRDRDDAVRVQPFNRVRGIELGSLALTPIGADHSAYEPLLDAQSSGEDRQGKTPAHRSIAYIRRPGMVVTYRAWGMMSPMSAIGVFQADKAVDQHLKLSEPVEHDRWDPHSRRLAALPFGAEIVKAVEDRCKARLREFLKSLQPPPPPPRNGLDWLGKMLAQILTPRVRANPPPPTGDRGDVSIITQKEPTLLDMGNGNVRLTATYAFSLKAHAEASERLVEISFRLNILEGDDSSKGEQLSMRLSSPSEDFETEDGAEGKARVFLRSSERVIVTAESEEFSSDWAVSIHVEANSAAQGAEA